MTRWFHQQTDSAQRQPLNRKSTVAFLSSRELTKHRENRACLIRRSSILHRPPWTFFEHLQSLKNDQNTLPAPGLLGNPRVAARGWPPWHVLTPQQRTFPPPYLLGPPRRSGAFTALHVTCHVVCPFPSVNVTSITGVATSLIPCMLCTDRTIPSRASAAPA